MNTFMAQAIASNNDPACPGFIRDVLRQCEINSSRIAVIDGKGRRSTYADFFETIRKTAGYIKARDIAPGSFVVINLPNCMEYLAVEFGAWISGCAIAPVSPYYPKARIDYIAGHCESPLIVDETVLAEIRNAERLDICQTTADIAALFYTSGSTGTPKGVMHTFETLSHIDSFTEYTQVDSDDCFAIGAPMSFIAWILILPYLRSGACVRLIPREIMTDIKLLQNLFDTERITSTIITPPSVLRRLNLKGNKTLRFVFTGSERTVGMESESSYRLINLYGQTETALTALYFVVDKAYQNTPIGKPTGDFEVKLAEDGEICLRGPLTPGYYKDPERSAALWQGGWLHTGDIGRMLPDGNVEYVNRKDWMVKINGQRVETGEIAAVIKEVKGVRDAIAKGFTAPEGQQYVVAYYIADDNVSDAAIKEYISGKLAPYMIPSYFVKMASFPTNFNGKVDVKSLQSPTLVKTALERTVVAPTTENEKILCKAFESALGISPVGIDDDFFSLGGDSIRVMQLQLACPQLDLSSTLVYKHKTVRNICTALSDSESGIALSGDICPLSKTQYGIFVECMSRKGEAVYNNPILYKFTEPVDADRLADACVKAVSAHPNVFATISVGEDGVPVQHKNPADGLVIKPEKVSDVEFDGIRAGLEQPFDILGDRLFRIRIFKAESATWLFADFHHIIFDGTSNGILLSDIEKAYRGGEVEPESFTGFDLACEEQQQRDSDFLEECRKWNLDIFREPDRTSLPDPDKFSDAVSFEKFDVNTGISVHAFSKAAERLGITENVLATGAFGHMLGACSHARNSAFATIYNGRKSVKTVRTMSMMVKTLPVFCKWENATTAGDYFSAVKEQLTGAMAHDLFSFAEICASTAYDSRVIFSYQDELLGRDSLCGSACEMISLLENATGEPLSVELFKDHGTMAIRTEYRSNMYSDAYIRKFIACYTTILSSLILAEKDSRLSSLNLVSEQESAAIISSGWGRKLPVDRSQTFVGMFRKNVAARPDSVAVVDENGSMSYSELDKASDTLAAILVSEGVAVEDFVAVMMPRRSLFPLAYVACFKSGAAYVPMDYEYPVDRLSYMLKDSQAKVLLTTRAVFEAKSSEGNLDASKVIFVDELPTDLKLTEGIDRSRPDGLAYMIYTSGTTGNPKGVMIEHHSLVNLVSWYADIFKIGPESRVAEHASFSFDGSVGDLMTPLCFGAQLHILPAAIRKDLAAMYRYFCENKIDSTLLTTQLGMTMLRMYDLKLKYMMVGGEKLSGQFKTSVKVYNGYGPTEFTVASSYYPVDPENLPDNIPIGKAVPNTLSAVVDACGRLLPSGVAGELVLIGEQLSRGYWQRPDITAERFTDCPFLPGKKMYHSGDLVKWDENGDLLFLGRIDKQVKLRGFRIELGEIESKLSSFEGIKASVVAVREIAGLQHLCAYYVSDSEIDKEALRNHLAQSLTDYMVPTAYVQMEALPMTPNGKVDLRSLPLPQVKAEEIVAPETELEKKIFDIVADYLKNSDFGVTSNLISMGLTSLGAITLSLQLERKAEISIPSPKILELPTIRQWAEYLGDNGSVAAESISAYEMQATYPMTDNQTGIYIDWEQHKDSIQYNVPMLFRFNGVSPETVASAVRSFVEAHSYLKMHLQPADGQVVQVRNDSLAFDVPVSKLESEPDKLFFQSLLKPFNLFEGPLFRFNVYTYGENVWLLSDVHHIIFDGGSEAIFAREIAEACNGAEIKPEEFSAFDYSLYYNEWKESEEFSKAEQYFCSLLEGTVAATQPSLDSPTGEGSATVALSVDRDPVRSVCRSAGVTENAFFLTAVTEVLHRFSREANIAILTVSNGRSLRSLERSCGMFVQTLPVVSHQAARKVGESLSIMHSQVVETLARDKFPYTKIVEKTGVKASILLAYQGDVLGGPLEAGGNEVELTGLALDTAKFPLSINVVPGPEKVEINFEYDRAAFSENDVLRFSEAVRSFILNMLSAGADAMINEISCVSSQNAEELIAVGSGEKMAVGEGTVVDLFKKQVAAHPDDPAVSDSVSTLSYAQLDKESDMFAGILLSAGLRKEDFVSLMMPRGKEFTVAYLAVFKSGGAYVPMDYEYPIDRLQYMVEDSMSKFLVTTHDVYDQKSAEGGIKVQNIIFIDDVDFSDAGSAAEVNNSLPEGLAYMIYTSGTTGKPKGVMIEHRALKNMITWNSTLVGAVRGTHFAEHPSFSFDASIMDLMTSPAFGGHLYIIGEESRKDPEALYKFIVENKIEVLVASTQLGMILLNSYKLPIRSIMLGGEKLTGRYDKSIQVINGYGPTEFTVCSSYHILDPDKESDNIPIGRAVPNTLSAVVDSCGQLVPRGLPGELVLVGPQIARGYWNKEEITRKRFVDCPFAPGQKMYHTGDLVRWSSEGELLFMGRIDTQVKLRGFRIELGEIESQMAAFKDVTAAVAQVKEIGGVQHLCAYFTATSQIDTAALKAQLASVLTSYMVPDAFLQMDAFPLTPNGKVDTKKLPLPDLTKASAAAFEAPEGELESLIAEAFQSVLGLQEPFSRNSSFFQMGGTSLLVMKVIVNLSDHGYVVTYGDVFKYPTPMSLAAFIEGYEAGHGAAPVPSETVVAAAAPALPVVGEDGYDYGAINALLKTNEVSEIDITGLDVNPVGDVLLLGSTGYLGIHVLRNLLENGSGKVYCLIRPRKGVTCAGRLKSYLMYYFDNTYTELLDKRLFVLEGDLTDDAVMEKLLAVKVDTVINCAANVKHFAAGDEIEKINLNGTQRLIEYCLKTGSRLVHTSTHSISGQTEGGEPHVMKESDLYFGQKMMTKYQESKFAAERAILEACAGKGLRAKIARLGNLMPRYSDGEFQINIENNGFMARMRAYYLIGCIPSEHLHSALEFAPIDETADAILTLARTPDKFTVFHPFNNHTVYIDDVIAVMRGCGLDIRVTDAAEFNERLAECLKDDRLNPYITTLLAYSSHNNYVTNPPSLEFTVNVLNAMDWRWSITGTRYLSDSFEKMKALDYFDK